MVRYTEDFFYTGSLYRGSTVVTLVGVTGKESCGVA